MSQFFDYKLKRARSDGRVLHTAWSMSQGVLAVASSSGMVAFFNEEGEECDAKPLQRDAEPTALGWQERGQLVAVGWSDGVVTLRRLEGESRDSPSVHRCPVRFVQWSAQGNRFVTGDDEGVIGVWRAEARGHLSPISQYRKRDCAMVRCVFTTPLPGARDSYTSPEFFVGGESGLLVVANDHKQSADVHNVNAPIDSMVWFAETRRIVILTRSLLMVQLAVPENPLANGVAQLMKVKVSVAGEPDLRHVSWASPGLLASASPGEKVIRFWDLVGDENYVLGLSSAGPGAVHRTDRVTTVSFNPRKRVLAAGTRQGKVLLWRLKAQATTAAAGAGANGTTYREALAAAAAGEGVGGADAADPGGEVAKLAVPTSAADWEPLPPLLIAGAGGAGEAGGEGGDETGAGVEGAVARLDWGPGENLLSVELSGTGRSGADSGDDGGGNGDGDDGDGRGGGGGGGGGNVGGMQVHVLNETVLHRALHGAVAAIQLSANSLAIEEPGLGDRPPTLRHIDVGIRIKGLVFDGAHVVVWNGKEAEVYDMHAHGQGRRDGAPQHVFKSEAGQIVVREDTIFRSSAERGIEVCNLSGHVKSTIAFTDEEGAPTLLDINNRFMAVATSKGRLKVFDVGRREPTQLSGDGRFEDAESGKSSGIMRSIRVNADGTRISIISDLEMSGAGASVKMVQPDTRLHVYNSDTGVVLSHDFGPGARPVLHSWDAEEAKLLACETTKIAAPGGGRRGSAVAAQAAPPKPAELSLDAGRAGEAADDGTKSDREVTTLFVTSEHGMLMQHSFELEAQMEAFLGLRVPRLYFIGKPGEGGMAGKGAFKRTGRGGGGGGGDDGRGGGGPGAHNSIVHTKVLRDFVGLAHVDDKTRKALLDFSFFITVGNMDEAHRAVKQIKSTHVWQNMAHMCVTTKRLDVAEVCLGNMGHARGARAVREAKKEPEVEAQVAMVAIQLGLLDDAARLYRECGRYDLLNKLFQAAGKWERALSVAKEHDRIHLRTTHYQYARHLESLGDTTGAIRHFEQSDTHRTEVPRLLCASNYIDDLEDYVQQRNDKALFKWWAQYCESNRDLERASRFYERAGDSLSMTRVACFNGDFEGAKAIVRDSGDKAAAYHLARQFEAAQDIQQAITYFSRAETYSHAIRLAKEHGLDSELMSFAIQANKSSMVETAEYLEKKGDFEKAVQLYQKGGHTAKALELCFRANLFDVLRQIADDVGDDASPATLARCADFFIENGQYEKACQMLTQARRFDEALDICVDQKVKLTDDMAEKMTLPKSDDAEEATRRLALLEKVAKCCKRQGSYQLACKKYTQAGDKLKAMKCLLKSGDTEKIIFFTKTCRNRNIFILAANYLQNLDWHNEPEVMKSIIQFYTKAKAFEQLSGFYDACAQVEMDEYRDYEKALGALQEAIKYLNKGKANGGDHDMAISHLQQRCSLIEEFVRVGGGLARWLAGSLSLSHSHSLLMTPHPPRLVLILILILNATFCLSFFLLRLAAGPRRIQRRWSRSATVCCSGPTWT